MVAEGRLAGSGWLAAVVIIAAARFGGGMVLPPTSPLATTPLRAPATLAAPPPQQVCLSPRHCGRLGDGGKNALCGWPMYGSFTGPIVNWGPLLNDGILDRDCCYDSDNDGTLDTNSNPGGTVDALGGFVRAYSGWPKSRSSAWGNCSRACWDLKDAVVICIPLSAPTCDLPMTRPVCPATSPDGKGSGGSGSGGGDDDDDDDYPQRQPRSTETSDPRTTPASGEQRLCNGKRDPKFCTPYESASECEVWELNTSCPVLCNACPATHRPSRHVFTQATTLMTHPVGNQAGGGTTSTTAPTTAPPGGGATPTASPGQHGQTGGGHQQGAEGNALVWAGAGAGTIIIAVAAGWLVYQRLRRRESTRIKAGRLSVSADRPGHVAMNAAFVEDIELDIEDDDDDALAVFDGTDAVRFDGRVRQHGELTFTPQSEL